MELLVHTDVMRSLKKKTGQPRSGIRAEEKKRRKFKKFVQCFRSATDAEKAKRLGDKLGQMVFG